MNSMMQQGPAKFTSLASQGKMATMWPSRLAATLRAGYKSTTPLSTAIDGPPDAPDTDPNAAPTIQPTDNTDAGQQQALSLATSMGVNGGFVPGAAAPSSRSSSYSQPLNPLLTTALNLAAAQQSGAEQDTLSQLNRAGVVPSPSDAPGVRANKLGYLASRLAAEYAHTQGGPAVRAPGTPVYTGSLPSGSPGTATLADGSAPAPQQSFDLTQQPGGGSANTDTSVVDKLVSQAHAKLDAVNQPQYFTDPATGQRFMQFGKTVMRDSPAAPGFPRSVSAGGKTMTEVAPGRFVDDAGNPVSWSSRSGGSKGASTKTADLRFPGVSVDANGKATLAAGTSADAGTPQTAPAQATVPKAKAFYNHDTVLEEIKRRGINR